MSACPEAEICGDMLQFQPVVDPSQQHSSRLKSTEQLGPDIPVIVRHNTDQSRCSCASGAEYDGCETGVFDIGFTCLGTVRQSSATQDRE